MVTPEQERGEPWRVEWAWAEGWRKWETRTVFGGGRAAEVGGHGDFGRLCVLC